MIRISKGYGYLAGIIFTLLIYLAGQLIFFINTKKTTATICDIYEGRGTGTYRKRTEFHYACFDTGRNTEAKVSIGSNLPYEIGDTVTVVYNINHPLRARLNTFRSLWVIPGLFYLIPLAFVMAAITGIYFGTKYVVIVKKPFRIYLENFLKPVPTEQRLH